ncbi:phytanoyl-CoA dioxygenase family protein [Bradyrhizobium barranii]|uniref:phytanoyl-CoA dioxygenase family protein n=1 Tax=Bradyrhizobium barranii TaxID=2992140 RepID=UPI001AA1B8AD
MRAKQDQSDTTQLVYAWHQDESYVPTRDKSLTSIWVALEDATLENGCLWVVPGSHRMGFMYPSRRTQSPKFQSHHPECYGFDLDKAVPLEVTTGTVVVFNGYLLHSSGMNASTRTRKSFGLHLCNSWCVLPWRIEGGTHAWADDRGIVSVSGIDPYFWKGSRKMGSPIFVWSDSDLGASDAIH